MHHDLHQLPEERIGFVRFHGSSSQATEALFVAGSTSLVRHLRGNGVLHRGPLAPRGPSTRWTPLGGRGTVLASTSQSTDSPRLSTLYEPLPKHLISVLSLQVECDIVNAFNAVWSIVPRGIHCR